MTTGRMPPGANLVAVWPEWNDGDVAAERWEPPTTRLDSKKKDPGTPPSPVMPTIYEDPDGRVYLPPPLRAVQWKRPQEINFGRLLVVRDNVYDADFDLISANFHLYESELMRSIISHIVGLALMSTRNPFMPDATPGFTPCDSISWKPWQHVYSNCKTGHIVHNPLTNPFGKYVVRIYYMGSWRKVYVDDTLPINAYGEILLPRNAHVLHELWPMLLTKALLKIASLECSTLSQQHKAFEFTAAECLTGWIPEQFEIHIKDSPEDVWPVFLSILRKYRFPIKRRSTTPGEVQESEEGLSKKGFYGKAAKVTKKLESRNVSPTDLASTPEDLWDEYGYNPAANMAVFADQRDIAAFMSDSRRDEILGIMEDFGMEAAKKYPVLVLEARMSPVEPPPAPSGTPRWKLIRRHLWDREFIKLKGVDVDEDPIRSVGLVLPWNAVRNAKSVASQDSTTPILSELGIKEEAEYGFHRPFPTQRVDWINHWRLCKCFGRITVFHRPNGYIATERIQDAKGHTGTGHSSPSRKAKGGGIPAFNWFTSGVPFYLFIDSARDMKVLLALALGGMICTAERSTTSDNTSEQSGTERSPVSGSSGQSSTSSFLGSIAVEPFYWRLQAAGRSLCNLKVMRSRSIFLILPPGRHVLRVTVRTSSPGLVIVCANSPITLTDDDNILVRVTGDPTRLSEAGKGIALDLLDSLQNFSDPQIFRSAQARLISSICPGADSSNLAAYLEAFNELFFVTFAKLMEKINLDIIFAARAFTLDMTMPFNNKQIGCHGCAIFMQRKSVKKSSPPWQQEPPIQYTLIEEFVNRYRDAASRYVQATIVLQKYARRYLARKVVQAMTPVSKWNARAGEQFLKASVALEKNLEEHGCSMLTTLFLLYPVCAFDFPFWTDELNHVTYHEYTGVCPILQPNTWFAVYRDVFHVTDAIPIVPTLSSDLSSCSVHIVNNDTALEVPHVFLKPDYYEYIPNKAGYTVLIEGCVRESFVNPCKWKLRLISPAGASFTPMPKEPASTLVTKEIKEYFIPNKDGILTRIALTTTSENVATIQCGLSNSDVNVILTVYDGNNVIRSVTGRGHTLLAAVMLHHKHLADGQLDSPPSPSQTGPPKKYIVEARIEKDTWLVHMSHIPFIQGLMLKERDESLGEPDKVDKGVPTTTDKKKKKDKQVVVESKVDIKAVTDPSRPHWTLRIVLDQTFAEGVDIRKDTSRADEIVTIKKKWDLDESGRNVEAERLRVAFLQTQAEAASPSGTFLLNEHGALCKSLVLSPPMPSPPFSPHKGSVVGATAKQRRTNEELDLIEASQMLAPQPLPTKIRLRSFDSSVYYHYRPFGPRVKDPKLEQAQKLAKEQRWQEYTEKRDMFASIRKQQDERRHQEKMLLVDQAETGQAKLEMVRLEVQQIRERNRLRRADEDSQAKALLLAAIEEARQVLEGEPKKKPAVAPNKKKNEKN